MSNHRYSKFWWQDWHSEPCLEMCSLAARGLWMELLCLAHAGEPYGHVTIGGVAPTTKQIAIYARTTEREVRSLIGELEQHKVFNRTEGGVIWSRRMVKDGKKAEAGTEGANRRWNKPPPNGSPNGSANGRSTKQAMGNPILNIHRSESESESAREPTSPLGGLGSRWQPPEPEPYVRSAETDAVIVALEARTSLAAIDPKPKHLTPEQLAVARKRLA